MVPPAGDGFDVRRIVVAIDNSAHAVSALEAAVSLAVRLHAELEGVFIEDINLARLADLPVGREIQFLTGQGRDFTAASHADQTREQISTARRAIAQAAGRARVSHLFRVARGTVQTEVITAAENADLLILGLGQHVFGRRDRVGTTAKAAVERAPRSVLISKTGMRPIGAPLICYDGSVGARHALDAAIRISGAQENGLTVLIVAPGEEPATLLRQEVSERIAQSPIVPKFLHRAQLDPDQICRIARDSGSDLLVIGADSDIVAGPDRLDVLERIACPVLIVR